MVVYEKFFLVDLWTKILNEVANVSWQLGLSNDVIWRDVMSAEFCVQFLALFHGQDHLVLSNFVLIDNEPKKTFSWTTTV